MSIAMSSAEAHYQYCSRGRDCRCPQYVVNPVNEGPCLASDHPSGTHYTQALPAPDAVGPLNPSTQASTYTGHYQTYTSQNAPPPVWAPQAIATPDAFNTPTTQIHAFTTTTASYGGHMPPTMGPAYPSYPLSLTNSKWDATNGSGTSTGQGIQVAPVVTVVAPIVESTRIEAVPGEERVYEIVTRVRY